MARRTDAGIAFLLVQLGAHTASAFAEALAPSGLEPRHVGLLQLLSANEGLSQQALGEALGLNATRVVFLVDDMEQRGLVERRRNPKDRRSHALYLTPEGKLALVRVNALGREHDAQLGASLTAAERKQLALLLKRVADAEGISGQWLPMPPPARGAAHRP
ncbi:MAG: hypothetical protein QOI55_237 [Actinomycetota bacterium]|nr:hypothetical protein [Actinomycetota bacterium]